MIYCSQQASRMNARWDSNTVNPVNNLWVPFCPFFFSFCSFKRLFRCGFVSVGAYDLEALRDAFSKRTLQACNKPLPCYLVPLFQSESSCKRFCMKMNLFVGKGNRRGNHFHMNGFARRRLVLTERQNTTRKWPLGLNILTKYAIAKNCVQTFLPLNII